jgi:peptidoglycan/LPS O-acetylase OafA/YrhL
MLGDGPIFTNEAVALLPSNTQQSAYQQISSGARIAELDGLRGLAAVLVVIAHYFGEVRHSLPGLALGSEGVDLFFVLSGFLIGSIILERKNSPNFLRVFYCRRALRIIPIYLLTLSFVLLFLAINQPAPWIDAPLPALSYMTFTQNIVMVATGDYGTHCLVPTWTLAVEEQFYLVIPLLVMSLPSRYLLAATLGGIAMGCGVRSMFYWAEWVAGGQVLLVSRCDILLCGVLVAYIHYRRIVVDEMTLRLIALAAALGFLLGSVLYALTDSSLHLMFGPLLVAALFAAYVLLAVRGWEFLRPLRSAGWRFFGSISYGLYLVHQPVAGAMHGLILGGKPDIGSLPQLTVTIAALIASIGIAWTSWNFIEAPLVRMGWGWRYN